MQHVVVMGASGSGKSTVGKLLARRLGATFVEGDLLHPKVNIAKMESGESLNDADRQPWLAAVGRTLANAGAESIVIACSALKKLYRDLIRSHDPTAHFILLEGSYELLVERLGGRRDHFMPPALLQSQLNILEPLEADEEGFTLNISRKPDELAKDAALLLAVP